ncbi:MAG: methionyl-tRNA formyltransferase [Patescibacteria group bacterium]|jgi:methionyl-tRNA formyltransferase
MIEPLGIVYFGSSEFAVPPLEALAAAPDRYRLLAVVTQPDRPAGRSGMLKPSPIKTFAESRGWTILQPEKVRRDQAFSDRLAGLRPDLFVVAAYGQILPVALLAIPRLGALNLHGSLLPKYRGASPIQAAIMAGEKKTGVSLMVMDELMDHGPVVATAEVDIGPETTFRSLQADLATVASRLLIDKIDLYADGALPALAQDHAAATATKIITKENGLIAWKDETAAEIERKIRAFATWPQAYAVWQRRGKPLRFKILWGEVADESAGVAPGVVFRAASGYPAVNAKKQALVLLKVQFEGKTAVDGRAILNGYPDLIGSRLD